MFDNTVKTLIDDVEGRDRPLLDADLTIALDTGDFDPQATLQAVNFSRKLRYLWANLTTSSARLTARQNEGANGFETWCRMNEQIAVPDATRLVSLITQLLDVKSDRFWTRLLSCGGQWSQSMKLSPERTSLIAYLLPLRWARPWELRSSTCAWMHIRWPHTHRCVQWSSSIFVRNTYFILHALSSSQGPAAMDIGYEGKGKGMNGKL